MGQIISLPYNVYSYFYPVPSADAAPPLVPPTILAQDIISHAAGQQIWDSMHERGTFVLLPSISPLLTISLQPSISFSS